MNTGRTLFAQIMDFVPWTSFQRIVSKYSGDDRVRTLSCTEQFRVLAFAQMTYRESLRDIEACLGAQPSKLYGMGLRGPVAKSTLADANERRNWRIWAEIAAVLIRRARRLYVNDDLGLDLTNTVYALDSTTIDLCLSLFPWADFRTTKAAVKMHTLLDLRGQIPSFIHVSDGKMGDALALDMIAPEAGSIYIMDRGYVDFRRLYVLHQAGAFFVWIKQNLRIRHFYGTSENAVKTQIWMAVSVYVLAAIIKKELALDVSLYTFLQVLSVHSFEKIGLSCAFQSTGYGNPIQPFANKLNLFES